MQNPQQYWFDRESDRHRIPAFDSWTQENKNVHNLCLHQIETIYCSLLFRWYRLPVVFLWSNIVGTWKMRKGFRCLSVKFKNQVSFWLSIHSNRPFLWLGSSRLLYRTKTEVSGPAGSVVVVVVVVVLVVGCTWFIKVDEYEFLVGF